MSDGDRVTGRIVTLKRDNGYCFVETLDGFGDRVFCHATAFRSGDWPVADIDDRVSFEKVKTADGRLRASDAELVDEAVPRGYVSE